MVLDFFMKPCNLLYKSYGLIYGKLLDESPLVILNGSLRCHAPSLRFFLPVFLFFSYFLFYSISSFHFPPSFPLFPCPFSPFLLKFCHIPFDLQVGGGVVRRPPLNRPCLRRGIDNTENKVLSPRGVNFVGNSYRSASQRKLDHDVMNMQPCTEHPVNLTKPGFSYKLTMLQHGLAQLRQS